MNRRDLFKGIIGAGVAAPVVAKAAAELISTERTPEIEPMACDLRQCGSFAYTPDQEKVLETIAQPDTFAVLFGGMRGRGATELCRRLLAMNSHNGTLVVDSHRVMLKEKFLHEYSHPRFHTWTPEMNNLAIRGHEFTFVILDDAHLLDGNSMAYICQFVHGAGARMLFTGMPYGPGYKWLRKRFITSPSPGWKFVQARNLCPPLRDDSEWVQRIRQSHAATVDVIWA